MGRIVVKIGGSCLKEPSDLQRAASLVESYDKPVVVVSAFYGLTDQLLEVINKVRRRDLAVSDAVNAITMSAAGFCQASSSHQDGARMISSFWPSPAIAPSASNKGSGLPLADSGRTDPATGCDTGGGGGAVIAVRGGGGGVVSTGGGGAIRRAPQPLQKAASESLRAPQLEQ